MLSFATKNKFWHIQYLPWCRTSTCTSVCFNTDLATKPLFCSSRILQTLFVSQWLPFISIMQSLRSFLQEVFLWSSSVIGVFCWRLSKLLASLLLTPQSFVLQEFVSLFQSKADNFLTVSSDRSRPCFLFRSGLQTLFPFL